MPLTPDMDNITKLARSLIERRDQGPLTAAELTLLLGETLVDRRSAALLMLIFAELSAHLASEVSGQQQGEELAVNAVGADDHDEVAFELVAHVFAKRDTAASTLAVTISADTMLRTMDVLSAQLDLAHALHEGGIPIILIEKEN